MHDLNQATHARVLIVDDNRAIHSDLRKVLAGDQQATGLAASAEALFGETADQPLSLQYEIDSAFQGMEALALVRAAKSEGRPYALAFVDMRMPPGWDGVETIQHLWLEDPSLQVCICTAYSDYSWSEISTRLKCNDGWLILKKPFDNIEVCQVAAALTEKRRLGELAHLRLHDLETRVAERTATLNETNEQLRREIADRMAVEVTLRDREVQLSNSKKLEAVGQLAGGVAHEFNNLLQIITGHGQCALDELSPAEPLYEELQQILHASGRAAVLVNQLLGFSRRQVLRPVLLDVNKLMTDFVEMARPLFGQQISLETSFHQDTNWANVDPDQLRQAILNLVLNARDAMPEEGILTLSTCNTSLATLPKPSADDPLPGTYVEIAVRDTGSGIPASALDRIFEPFFTTKDIGKGTGLGLAMVHGVVKQHGGTVSVSSQDGAGATFRILLPAFEPPSLSHRVNSSSDSVSANDVDRATGAIEEPISILLAEDDPQIRTILARTLTKAGYRVLQASNGHEALEVFQSAPEIQLALLDVIMPKMDGKELYTRLRAQRPDLRAVFCTGYDPECGPAAKIAGLGVPVLCKPVTRDSLLKTIRMVLAEPVAANVRELVASPE